MTHSDTGGQPIAITGVGVRLPGGIRAPAALWQLLVDGGTNVARIPADRLPIDELHDPGDDVGPGRSDCSGRAAIAQSPCPPTRRRSC